MRFAAAGWDKTSGGNFSFIPSGSLDSGTIAALLAAGANSFTGAAFEAPAMVALEEGVLSWIAGLLGLPAGTGGLLLSGGSLANQTAIVTARNRAGDAVGGTMYVSERVHHSVVKAAHLIGVPPDAIRTVSTDGEARCDPNALQAQIDADTATGRSPFLVVGVAGSTDTGSIDQLDSLADIAERAGAWFHVDAAYGGFFALTERGRERLRGIERADSVTIDAHKGLFLPYSVGALLVRDPILRGSCACRASSFEVKVHPTERFICHCLFCQSFVGRSYTDVTIMRASDVVIHNNENVTYRKPQLLPPGFAQGRGSRFGDSDRARFVKCADLDRGTCDMCGQPFIETIGPGNLGAVFIPSANFDVQADLPPVQRHIFDRLHEVEGPNDQLPRHDGFVASQVAIVGMVLRTFLARKTTNA